MKSIKSAKHVLFPIYTTLVKKTRDRHALSKGLSIYELAQSQCVDLLSSSQNADDEIIFQMQTIAETIPEYNVLRSMPGVGDRLGPIILAEIGDIRRFHSSKSLYSPSN